MYILYWFMEVFFYTESAKFFFLSLMKWVLIFLNSLSSYMKLVSFSIYFFNYVDFLMLKLHS